MSGQQMPARIALSELIERVEAAQGPSRRLDFDLWVVLTNPSGFPALSEPEENRTSWFETWKDRGGFPRYTSSIDAALTLLPDGYAVERLSIWKGAQASCGVLGTHIRNGEYWHEHKDGRWRAECATPALAIVASCLKARLAMSSTQDTEAR